MLWLLASEYDDGDVPADPRKIAFRMRMSLEELALSFEPLLRRGFFEIISEDGGRASITLAECEQDAIPEKEIQVTSKTQVQTEGESARGAPRSPRKSKIPENFPSQALLEAAVEFWTERGRSDLCATVADEAQHFRDWCAARGETALDWPAKWRAWTRTSMKINPRKDANGRAQRSKHDAVIEGGALAIQLLERRNSAGDYRGAEQAGDALPQLTVIAANR